MDGNFSIRNVVADWPGATHDPRILQNSGVYRDFEDGTEQGVLLGDSGYPLKRWLLVPFLHPACDAEENYNRQV